MPDLRALFLCHFFPPLHVFFLSLPISISRSLCHIHSLFIVGRVVNSTLQRRRRAKHDPPPPARASVALRVTTLPLFLVFLLTSSPLRLRPCTQYCTGGPTPKAACKTKHESPARARLPSLAANRAPAWTCFAPAARGSGRQRCRGSWPRPPGTW